MIGDGEGHGALIVDGDPGQAAQETPGLRRRGGVEGEEPLGDLPGVGVLLGVGPRPDEEAMIGVLHHDPLGLLHRGRVARAVAVAEHALEGGQATGVQAAFHGLHVVALHQVPGDVSVAGREVAPLELGPGRGPVRGAQIGPVDAGPLPNGEGVHVYLVLQGAFRGLEGRLQTVAVDVELPATELASQAALLVEAVGEVGATVGASGVQEAGPVLGIAEGHQALAHDANADRVAVGLGEVSGQQDGGPEPAEEVAHGRAWARAHQGLVVFGAQHGGASALAAPSENGGGGGIIACAGSGCASA